MAATQFDLVEVVCLCAYIYQRKLMCILKSSLFSLQKPKVLLKKHFGSCMFYSHITVQARVQEALEAFKHKSDYHCEHTRLWPWLIFIAF